MLAGMTLRVYMYSLPEVFKAWCYDKEVGLK